MSTQPSIMSEPSDSGRFGEFGGRFVPEPLVPACQELERALEQGRARQQELAQAKAIERKERGENIQYGIIVIGIVTMVIVLLLLSRSFIVNHNWIRFLGILSLLLFFEFLSLILHPYLAEWTHHSPIGMLMIMVLIASLIIPFHHRLEHWAIGKLVEKNKQVRLAAAKKIVSELER